MIAELYSGTFLIVYIARSASHPQSVVDLPSQWPAAAWRPKFQTQFTAQLVAVRCTNNKLQRVENYAGLSGGNAARKSSCPRASSYTGCLPRNASHTSWRSLPTSSDHFVSHLPVLSTAAIQHNDWSLRSSSVQLYNSSYLYEVRWDWERIPSQTKSESIKTYEIAMILTESRFSLTHYANKSSRWGEE